jgi:hypothetical protein
VLKQSFIGVAAVAAMLGAGIADAAATDWYLPKYPDLRGVWVRAVQGAPRYDTSKPPGRGQQAPLTPEYQKVFEETIKDQLAGGQGGDPTYTCLSPGMPRIMNVYDPMEIVVTPETTHLLIEHIHDSRRIHTDGRDWPKEDIDPSFRGYSIGKWIDTDGDGKFDTLEVETRHLNTKRTYDAAGIPFHVDGKTVIKEKIYQKKDNPNILVNEMITFDNALTRPWAATKEYRRDPNIKYPIWREAICAENNVHVEIGGTNYVLSAEGLLMPARKNQAPPDLRYFNQTGR